jgi:hypothetical protein
MIRITQQDSAPDAKRYYATADYYSQGQEIVGRWGGKGAALLGLEGTVDKFSFERLCDNLDPKTGEPLKRLKELVAELTLDNRMLKHVAEKNW